MRVVFTGSGGKAGSWKMRAEQLASTRTNWKAIPKATRSDFRGADVVVLVKRVPEGTLQEIKNWGGYLVYDPLDFWKQPEGAQGIYSPEDARVRFREHFEKVDADIVLATNSLMKEDLSPICKKLELFPHHFDPALSPIQPRNKDEIVYWGHHRYLAEWEWVAQDICKKYGFRLKINPKDPTTCEAMFAIRAGLYGTWLDRRWKSSVKGATAMALGVPLIAYPEASLVEHCSSHLWSFTNEKQLERAVVDAMSSRHRIKPCPAFDVQYAARRLEKIIGC